MLIRPPDEWGLSVSRGPCGGLYLQREIPSEYGRGWAVSKLAAPGGYYVHLSDAGKVHCDCPAFQTEDHCKHARLILDVLRTTEGLSVNPELPPDWKNSPLKAGLPELPAQIASLPVAANGYPVPWFVAWNDGRPDFRVADPRKLVLAVRESRCWVCGMGIPPGPHTFVAGPYCVVNHKTAEPPCHHQCAVFAATACPFLIRPKMVRREEAIEGTIPHAGMADPHNPGVAVLVVSSALEVIKLPDGIMFGVGKPRRVEWYAEGRPATRQEAEAAFDYAADTLLKLAASQEKRRPGETRLTQSEIDDARKWLPDDPPPRTEGKP